MTNTPTTENMFRIEVAADKMSAVLIVDSGAVVSVRDVFGRIKKLGIRGFDDGAIIEALESRGSRALRIEFVRGEPPVEPTPGQLEYLVPVGESVSGAFTVVETGQELARITPGRPGRDGHDVFRQVVHAPHKSFRHVGSGVAVQGDRLIATRSGSFRVKDGQACVGSVREVEAGSITRGDTEMMEGDLLVKGSLKPRQRLNASGGIVIQGGIVGASLRSGEWMHVRDAIEGTDKCRIIVGGDLYAGGILTMRVNALGDVVVSGDVRDSHVECLGKLDATGHSVSGGFLIANGGVTCHTLGAPDGTPTVVEVGVDEPLRLTLADTRPLIEAFHQRMVQAQQSMKALSEARAMTAEQKDRVGGVVAEVNDMRQDAKRKVAALIDRCSRAEQRQKFDVRVTQTLHAGVTLRFPGVEATTTESVAGPLRVVRQETSQGLAVAIEKDDGTQFVLPAAPRDDAYDTDVRRMLSLAAA